MKLILILCSFLFTTDISHACFIAKAEDKILQIEGDCEKRYPPCSTFKIPLSLMGFDSGILIDEINPVWSFKQGYVDWRDAWKRDQTPKSWMKESCVWYSQVLTKELGMEKFQDYVTKFDYGNKDLSVNKGQNNALTNAWLSSSLQTSSLEQVAFLQRMLDGKLHVKPYAVEMTKNILFVEELKDGWKLYGKTGMGGVFSIDGTKDTDLYHGWFIGWIEKGDRRIIFSNHIEDSKKEEIFASLRAKAEAKERLMKIIDEMKVTNGNNNI